MILYILLFIALTWLALFVVVLFEKFREHSAMLKERKAEAHSGYAGAKNPVGRYSSI